MKNKTATSLELELRLALTNAYQGLARAGLNSGSSGNISCRFHDGVLISPTGADGDTISAPAMVSITLDGQVLGLGVPSSEWAMHAEIYRRYPSANAIVHTHADSCVALACQRRPIPAFHYMIAAFGGDDIRCAGYATFGTQELAQLAADALNGRSACLLANHGMICHGPTIDKALANAIQLETLARQYWMSLQGGGAPAVLDSAEMARVTDRYRNYGTTALSQGVSACRCASIKAPTPAKLSASNNHKPCV